MNQNPEQRPLSGSFVHFSTWKTSLERVKWIRNKWNIHFMCGCDAWDKEPTNMYQRKHKSITTFTGAGSCKRTPSVRMKHCIGKLTSQSLAKIAAAYPECNRHNLCMFIVVCSIIKKNAVFPPVYVWIFLPSLRSALKKQNNRALHFANSYYGNKQSLEPLRHEP